MNYCYEKLKLLLIFFLLLFVDNLFGQQGQENYELENYMYEVNVTPNWCGDILGSIEVIVPDNNSLNYRWEDDPSNTDLVRFGLLPGIYYLIGEDPLINATNEKEECIEVEERIKIEVPMGHCSFEIITTDLDGIEGVKYCKNVKVICRINGIEVDPAIFDIEWEIIKSFGIFYEYGSDVNLSYSDIVTLTLSYTAESQSGDPQIIPCCSLLWNFQIDRGCEIISGNGLFDEPSFKSEKVQSVNSYPNPFSDKLITEVYNSVIGEGQVEVYDKFQRRVHSESRFMEVGENIFDFNFQKEKAGVYYVLVRFPDGTTVTEKVILIK